jgi:hypothetical protein
MVMYSMSAALTMHTSACARQTKCTAATLEVCVASAPHLFRVHSSVVCQTPGSRQSCHGHVQHKRCTHHAHIGVCTADQVHGSEARGVCSIGAAPVKVHSSVV